MLGDSHKLPCCRGRGERSPRPHTFRLYLPLGSAGKSSSRSLCRGGARVAEAQREIALPRSGFGSGRGGQARGREIGHAGARLQDRKVAEVTELTTVIEVVAVEQARHRRRRDDNKECEYGRRGG